MQSGDLSDGEIPTFSSQKSAGRCTDPDEPKRFDPGDFDSEYKLDASKEKYVKKIFINHLSDERINQVYWINIRFQSIIS